ncbi:MAG TPA: SDR family oxidoreductase [Kofleriaceae bacterium]|nr:SDR family oxidoreductase [Kofleriaceae bacterium]
MTLQNSRVVVLGGTAGIGLAVARGAGAQGATVAIVSSNRVRVDAAVAAVARAEGHVVDLRDEAAIAAVFERIGAFDHLVYTAGDSLVIGPLAELDLAKSRSFFDVRYWGALAAVKHAAKRVRSSITLTGGTAGRRGHPGWALGASVCGAMESLGRVLAVELAPIRVNVVIPGLVETELWASMAADARAKLFAQFAETMPVRRVGQPEDIAAMYLAVMANPYVTGEAIVVDGGGVLV